jgi:ParB-like chromosome segregation protein Spo0J
MAMALIEGDRLSEPVLITDKWFRSDGLEAELRPEALPALPSPSRKQRPEWVSVDDLKTSFSVRSVATDRDHVNLLAEVVDQWPPILIQRYTGVVIDGRHRVEAARLLGKASMLAERVDCSDDYLVLYAVERNNAHGLPLTLADRKRAAQCVLKKGSDVSDRWVAQMCGLAHSTVARLRTMIAPVEALPLSLEEGHLTRRVGRDGRRRPQKPQLVRERVRDALIASPDASLRAIAAQVGVSPETVRNVRKQLHTQDDAPELPRRAAITPLPRVERSYSAADDTAFQGAASSAEFASWFDRRDIGSEWAGFVYSIPIGRVYDVADSCKRRAKAWHDFAEALEARAVGSRGKSMTS